MALQGTPNISSATTLTLTAAASIYVYNGAAAATWTLPAVSGNSGEILILYNRGSGSVTVQRAGSDQIDNQGGLVNSVPLSPNTSLELLNDGTYWLAMSSSSAPLPVFDNSAQGASSQSTNISSGVATTWTQTVGAGNPYGLVCLYANDSSTTPANTTAVITFGGVSLAQLGYVFNANLGYMWLFGAPNIPSGSQTVNVTLTRTGASFAYIPMSYTYFNVAATGSFWSNQGSGNGMWVTTPRTTALPTRSWCGLETTSNVGASAVTLITSSGNQRRHYDAQFASTVTAWGFDTGIAGSDPSTYAIAVNNGSSFTAASLELFGQLPAGPYIHTLGTGLLMNAAFGQSGNTFTHVAAAGTYALVCVWYRKNTGTSLGGVSFGGTAMTQLASVYMNNDTTGANGQLFIYGLANVSGGSKTVTLTYTGGTPSFVLANSATYYQVSNVGTAATVFGNGTALSQGPISASPSQVIFQCFGSADGATITETGSEATLYSAAISNNLPGALNINHFPSGSHTFTGTTNTNPWAGIALVLS